MQYVTVPFSPQGGGVGWRERGGGRGGIGEGRVFKFGNDFQPKPKSDNLTFSPFEKLLPLPPPDHPPDLSRGRAQLCMRKSIMLACLGEIKRKFGGSRDGFVEYFTITVEYYMYHTVTRRYHTDKKISLPATPRHAPLLSSPLTARFKTSFFFFLL